ncbi:winged helix-turn-helix domain-containing protein [Bowmanella dokdonensis]|uniref:Winged helix-turn-helix domain-containing protein n=1 Tax=Bowmanella dokdonensis TaxID=751969 RepID=A0A939DMA5_9ALTE|nr:winged helix-turn-helix domain-containing protein [Bowmanella dokdonensis]MBN7825247.1 winged helix-turn-helix domain-containing protein [Bowmanella dokdonensis]
MQRQQAYSLGNCRIEPSECAIYHQEDEKQSLQPKFIEVLNYLVSHYPRVVSRQELIEHVWQGNEYVGEKALTNAIWHLRQALKQDTSDELIETIRKTGYRLLIAPRALESRPEAGIRPVSGGLRMRVIGIAIVLLGTALGGYWLTWLQAQPDKRTLQTITTEPGLELFPAASPDGRFIVYKWIGPGGQVDLFKRDLQQPELDAVRLTYDLALEGHSVWSSNGQYLYFSRKNTEQQQCHVVRMDMQNYQENFVANCPLLGGYHYIDISADDGTLAFYGDEEEASQSGIYLLDLTNPEARPVRFSCDLACSFKERDMAFSPDGKYLAVTRRFNQFNENIYLVELANGAEKQLTSGEEDIVGLSWHPNGQELVYGVQRADTRFGYLLDLKTGHSRRLDIAGMSYPNFARTRPWLFFQHRTEQYQIAAYPLDQQVHSSPFPVLQSGYNHKYPDYSDAQGMITYLSNETGAYEVWIADANGDNRRQLTHLNRSARYPKWSRDGTRIAFLAPDEDGSGDHIFVVEVATKRVTRLESPFTGHNRPFWAPDGLSILTTAFTQDHADIYRFYLDGRPPQRLTHNRGRYGVLNERGELVYSAWGDGLWALSLISGELTQLLTQEQFQVRYAWTVSDQGIYYLSENDQHQELQYYSLQEQSTKVLLRAPRGTFVGDSALTLDKARQQILFTKTLFYQSDIKLLKHP